jgi:phosphoserine phosphatase
MRDIVQSMRIPDGRVAAVGDTRTDSELLQAADLRFFVGTTAPPGVDEIIHIPNGDLRIIADRILERWNA